MRRDFSLALVLLLVSSMFGLLAARKPEPMQARGAVLGIDGIALGDSFESVPSRFSNRSTEIDDPVGHRIMFWGAHNDPQLEIERGTDGRIILVGGRGLDGLVHSGDVRRVVDKVLGTPSAHYERRLPWYSAQSMEFDVCRYARDATVYVWFSGDLVAWVQLTESLQPAGYGPKVLEYPSTRDFIER